MSAIKTLNSLGWLWRDNGVEVCVDLDGQLLRVFVPLHRVVLTFHNELAREGYQVQPRVGGCSVGGLFDDIGSAVSSIGKGAARAVSRAGSSIVRTASKWGSRAVQGAVALGRNKWVRGGLMAASMAMPALAPAAAGLELANRAYDAGRQVQSFVRHPTFGGALSIASQAAPGPYGEIARRALPVATQGASFLRHPTFGGAMALAQHAPGPFGGYAQQANRFAGYARNPSSAFSRYMPPQSFTRYMPQAYRLPAPAMQRAMRRSSIFGQALRGFY